MLSLGFSPCPNDTFIFHALGHGLAAVASDTGSATRGEGHMHMHVRMQYAICNMHMHMQYAIQLQWHMNAHAMCK